MAHTNIRGNNLADATAKLAVTNFDTLPLDRVLRMEVGAIAPHPLFLVIYTDKPQTLIPAFAIGPSQATLRSPWWTIPEGDRLQILAFPNGWKAKRVRQELPLYPLPGYIHYILTVHYILTTGPVEPACAASNII
jgi:hypothetical protein